MKKDIYYEIAFHDPLWQWGRLAMYRNGFVLFEENHINFEFFPHQKGEHKMPKSIEKWIGELVAEKTDKAIKNANLASKAFVKSCIMHSKSMPQSQPIDLSNLAREYLYNNQKPLNGNWSDNECEILKKRMNEFIATTAKDHNRTPGSIKAKMHRIFQKSYQEV